MQIEITLTAPSGREYSARDLGFLLHKHPDHLHERETAAGKVYIFYPEVDRARTTAVLYLEIDPVELVRGKNRQSDGLLEQYVNDRPFVANSFLSVALARSYGQSMSGKSKERQELADTALPYEARIVPASISGGIEVAEEIFAPLGYEISATALDERDPARLFDLRISGEVRLSDLLKHLYVLVPVLDNTKHYWIDRDEIEKLVAKGEGWLEHHPAKELIARRALRHRRSLARIALSRLMPEEVSEDEETQERQSKQTSEQEIEVPIRLHTLRLETVMEVLKDNHVGSVLDLGCGEGKLLRLLIKERRFNHICGVDPSVRAIERASRRLHLERAGKALQDRLKLEMGSLTYSDRRWRGFDAATLVEVIEHIELPRLSALEFSLFGDACPGLVVVTTPNKEYNSLFENLAEGEVRHPDHRFEWTREEFQAWAGGVAEKFGYSADYHPIGPEDETHGSPSQMAIFKRVA